VSNSITAAAADAGSSNAQCTPTPRASRATPPACKCCTHAPHTHRPSCNPNHSQPTHTLTVCQQCRRLATPAACQCCCCCHLPTGCFTPPPPTEPNSPGVVAMASMDNMMMMMRTNLPCMPNADENPITPNNATAHHAPAVQPACCPSPLPVLLPTGRLEPTHTQ
jgi:hypothetical protein